MSLSSNLFRFMLLVAMCILPACGGGGDVVSNTTDGILSVEHITSATATGGQGSVSVKLIAPTGGPGTGIVTIASGDASLVTFSPASQKVNSNGEAIFYFTASDVTVDTIVPFTVSVGSLSLTKQITLTGSGALGLTITLPASADTAGTVTATFAGGTKATGRKITLTSDTTFNIALDTTEQPADATGSAVFSYRVVNLFADTTITFTATSGSQSVSKSILVPANTTTPPPVVNPQVNSIAFVSATPTSISLKGTGGAGRSETAIVTFIVKDVTGQPIGNQTVDFTLNTNVGGITRIPTSAISDAGGVVKTIVNAGVVPTPVRITATIRGKAISAVSDQLTISTGLPHQDGLSVAAETINPEAFNYDNVVVPITAMLTDHYGNPVPDGTAVSFTTYGGSIEPSGTTTNGMVTVAWRSQAPRPIDAIARILVYTIGEESFNDLNGNGLADPGEFTDLPEAFQSRGGKATRDAATDPFIDFNGDGVYNTGDGKFNGVLQGSAYIGAPRSLHIFKNIPVIMSGSHAVITPDAVAIAQSASTNVSLNISDENGNILPYGTTITLSSTSGGCSTPSGFAPTPASFKILNARVPGQLTTTLTNRCAATGSGNLTITVKTPAGNETIKNIVVTY